MEIGDRRWRPQTVQRAASVGEKHGHLHHAHRHQSIAPSPSQLATLRRNHPVSSGLKPEPDHLRQTDTSGSRRGYPHGDGQPPVHSPYTLALNGGSLSPSPSPLTHIYPPHQHILHAPGCCTSYSPARYQGEDQQQGQQRQHLLCVCSRCSTLQVRPPRAHTHTQADRGRPELLRRAQLHFTEPWLPLVPTPTPRALGLRRARCGLVLCRTLSSREQARPTGGPPDGARPCAPANTRYPPLSPEPVTLDPKPQALDRRCRIRTWTHAPVKTCS